MAVPLEVPGLIGRKRDGGVLTAEEISAFVAGYLACKTDVRAGRFGIVAILGKPRRATFPGQCAESSERTCLAARQQEHGQQRQHEACQSAAFAGRMFALQFLNAHHCESIRSVLIR